MLNGAKISCHHGVSRFENQLTPVINLFNIHPQIDILEIDFVYYDKTYISSHDYELCNIVNGNPLSEWIHFIMKMNKILWIDLKDDNLSILNDTYSKIKLKALFHELSELQQKYNGLQDHVIIGCQYSHIYKKLLQIKTDFVIIRDLPEDVSYVIDACTPDFLKEITNYVNQSLMDLTHNNKSGITAIDKSFFDSFTNLEEFIEKLKTDVVIVYNFDLCDNYQLKSDKHIIYQYNFFID